MINLRNALMGGKRLPYDAEVEFLQSTGTQWIDTGVAFSQLYTFKLCARLTPPVNERDLFGAYFATEINRMVCGCYNRFIFGFNPPGARIDSATLGTSELDVDIVYAFSSAGRTLTVNGTTYSATGAYTNGLNVTLFRANPGYDGAFKCCSFKIYDTDGITLVRDFIPVRKKTVGYLYDRVSGKLFGNAGTGDFVLGPDVVPVEYIESHGTEYIDTGVYGDLDTVAEFRAAATANDALYPLFGARRSYYQNALAVYNGSDVGYKYTASYDNIRPGNLSLVSDVSADVGAWVDFHVGKNMRFGSWQKDTISYASSFSTLHTLCLFAWNQNGTVSCGKYKVSYLKTWQNGILVRDYIPIRVGPDATSWEGAMMDVLSRRIYRNQGTGAFTYGNDLKYPIPAA